MAYAPTTWDANDVITKDKLNKIEQGINTASKLSGTDIDTDKDWNEQNITNMHKPSERHGLQSRPRLPSRGGGRGRCW
jgi:nitrate reductase beta subunit